MEKENIIDEKVFENLEKLTKSMGDLNEQLAKNDVTNLKKLSIITAKTGIDLYVIANNIVKDVMSNKSKSSEEKLIMKILEDIADFVTANSEIKAYDGDVSELINKIYDRNILIYEILYEEKVDISNMRAVEARKKFEEIQAKIVSQISIMVIDALKLMFEGIIAVGSKELKK